MSLPDKLNQLNLKAMSREIEATLADAAARNLSVTATGSPFLPFRLILTPGAEPVSDSSHGERPC